MKLPKSIRIGLHAGLALLGLVFSEGARASVTDAVRNCIAHSEKSDDSVRDSDIDDTDRRIVCRGAPARDLYVKMLLFVKFVHYGRDERGRMKTTRYLSDGSSCAHVIARPTDEYTCRLYPELNDTIDEIR